MAVNKIILLIISACVLSFCIWRDIQLEKQYPGDLRNRIVGARLQKDGILPYFYKWQPQDSLRYYDPQNFDTLRVSNITATPFLHQLFYPLAEQPQRSSSRIWLLLEYCCVFVTAFLALSFARSKIQRWGIMGVTLLFLLTAGWQAHIAAGQYYILIPFLCMLFYYFTSRKKFLVHAFITGILAIGIILIRPNTLPFFLPFLFLWIKYPLRYKLVFIVSALTLLAITFGSTQRRSTWDEYRVAMSEQVKAHQGYPVSKLNTPDPRFIKWEGWDKRQIEKDGKAHVFNFESDHGNLFIMIKRLFGLTLPVWVFMIASVIFMLILIFIFYKRNVIKNNLSLFNIVLLGFCLYMISDLSAPFYRYQYNATQWIFPLLLAIAHYNRRYKYIYMLLLTGLLLNVVEIHSIPFEHPAGEYLILIGLLFLAFMYTPASQTKNNYIYPHA